MHGIHRRHRDGQRAFPAAQCALCREDLSPGEPIWRLGGRSLCTDCFAGRLLAELTALRPAGEGVRQ